MIKKLPWIGALVVLAVVLVMVVAPAADGATTVTIDGAKYSLTDSGVATYTKAPSSTAEITVPESVVYDDTTYSVTAIGSAAFKSNTTITTVTLPSTVTSLPSSCFSGCKNLTSIDLGGVTTLSASCFVNCGFTSIDSSVITSLGTSSFKSCTSLVSVNLPNVSSVTSSCFSACTALETVTFASVTSFGSGSFSGCTSLTTVNAPQASSISSTAFSGCTQLTTLNTSTITSLGNRAFLDCELITSFDISGLSEIGYAAFAGTGIPDMMCIGSTIYYIPSSLTEVELPEGIDTIGGGAFYGITMDSYTVPDCITSINDYGFYGSNIGQFYISDSVSLLGSYAFYYCENITSIRLPAELSYIGDHTFDYCTSLPSIDIPDTVNYVGTYSFANCTILDNVVLPDILTSVGTYMFKNCYALTTIDLGGVTTFGDYMFQNCTSLESIVLPEGSTPGTYMFSGCTSLSSVTLPSDLTEIPQYMFKDCSSLTSIDLEGITSIGNYALSGTGITELTVPASLEYDGLGKISSTSLTKVVFLPTYLNLAAQTFSGCTNLQTVEIYGTVSCGPTSIFTKCTSLDEFIIHSTVPFDYVTAFNATPLSSLVSTDSDNCTTYITGTLVDGDSSTEGKIALTTTDSTALTLDSTYIAASRKAIETVVNAGGTFEVSDDLFELTDDTAYSGTALVMSTANTTIRDGTTIIMPKSLDKMYTNTSIVFPSSVEEIWNRALTNTGTMDEVLFYSSPTIEGSSLNFSEDTNVYYLNGVYDESLSGVWPPDGYFVDVGESVVYLLPNEPLACVIDTVTDGSTLAFSVTPAELYSLSEVTVTVNNAAVPVAASGTAVNGEDVSGMYILENVGDGTEVVISGLALNTYDIELDVCEGAVFSVMSSVDLPHGTDVVFSVEAAEGYSMGESYAVEINGSAATPDSTKTGYCLYSFTILENTTVSVTGIEQNEEVSVAFDSDGGSEVSSQTLLSGQSATRPENPTKDGYVFGGWMLDGELYGFGTVEESVTLLARWFSEDDLTVLKFSAEHGSVTACVNGESVPSGSRVPVGSDVVLYYEPQYGHEATSWTVNGEATYTCADELAITIEERTVVTVQSQYYATGTPIHETTFITPLVDNYTAEWQYGGGGTSSGMSFSNMIYAPSVMGDYIYCKCDNYLVKIDFDGNEVARVETATSFSGYYEYLAVGNGLILDCITGKVFNEDLEQVFAIAMSGPTGYYHDGYFYMSNSSATGCYLAEDLDTSIGTDYQQPVWKRDLGILMVQYRGTSNMIFENDFMMITGADDDGSVFLLTANYSTGEVIDKIYIPAFQGYYSNTGYIGIFEGYATMCVYSAGLFETPSVDIQNIATIEIDDEGNFDHTTLRTVSSGTKNGQMSTMVIQDGLGYVFANTEFQVYDIETLDCIASVQNDQLFSHGDMAITTAYDGKVYAYRLSYASSTDLYVGVYDIETGVASLEILEDVCIDEWCSQQVHFLPDGRMVFVNDKGYLYCVGFSESSFSEDGLEYEIADGENGVVNLVGYETAPTGELVIPSTVDHDGATYVVGQVSSGAFEGCTGITSLVVNTSVEPGAFDGCTGLLTVDFGESTSVSSKAFYECSSLTEVTMPNVSEIGDRAFAKCTSLQTVTLGDATVTIDDFAFYNCTQLSSVNLQNADVVGDWAFYGCALAEADLSGAVEVCDRAFAHCDSLEAVTVGELKAVLGDYAFYDCGSLATASLQNVKEIGSRAFAKCDALGTVTLEGPSVTIGKYAFYNCTSLSAIGLQGATEIGDWAFYGCAALSVASMSSATSVGLKAFYGCDALENVSVGGDSASVGDYAFYGCAALSVADLSGAVSIGDRAFAHCTSLSELTLGGSGVALDDYAFYRCTALTEVDLSGVVSIGGRAFANCSALKDVTFGDSAFTISKYAFYRCALGSADLGSATSIGYWAFSGNSLTQVVFSENLSEIDARAFNGYRFLDSEGARLEVTADNLAGQTFAGEDKALTAVVDN